MRMVYTNENRFIVGNAKNILEINDLDVVLRNEHASSAIGEVSALDSWVELWVLNDNDYDRACEILEASLSGEGEKEWVCTNCTEENDASFEDCRNGVKGAHARGEKLRINPTNLTARRR